MNSKTRNYIILWIGMAGLVVGACWEPCQAQINLLPGEILPILQDVNISASVALSSTGIFTYSYTVSNPASNTGEIEDVEVDISRSTQGVALDSTGLVNDATVLNVQLALGDKNAFLVPVGLQSPSSDWIVATAVNLTASWGAIHAKSRIKPGNALEGFVLQSKGIPGIRIVMIRPKFKQTPVPDATLEDVQRLRAIKDQIKFSTVTLGPIDPASFNPESLIGNLIALKHQSLSLSWLGGKEFVEELDEKLDQAKKALAKGHGFQARKKLEQFIKKLEQQRKEQLERQHEASEKGKEEREEHNKDDKTFLTDNAFFLLKPNAEFIISKLPQKPKDEDEEHE